MEIATQWTPRDFRSVSRPVIGQWPKKRGNNPVSGQRREQSVTMVIKRFSPKSAISRRNFEETAASVFYLGQSALGCQESRPFVQWLSLYAAWRNI